MTTPRGVVNSVACTRREPFNYTPMAVNPISSGSPHVRPMGRTCGEPGEIKKNTHPKYFTALFRAQDCVPTDGYTLTFTPGVCSYRSKKAGGGSAAIQRQTCTGWGTGGDEAANEIGCRGDDSG